MNLMQIACRFHGPGSLVETGTAPYTATLNGIVIADPNGARTFDPAAIDYTGDTDYHDGEEQAIVCSSFDNFDGWCGVKVALFDKDEALWRLTEHAAWASAE